MISLGNLNIRNIRKRHFNYVYKCFEPYFYYLAYIHTSTVELPLSLSALYYVFV